MQLSINPALSKGLTLTLNPELLYVCAQFSALALRSQCDRQKAYEFFPSVHLWQTISNRLQTAEFSLYKYVPKKNLGGTR
jgi:hypothetical protein